MIQRKFIIPILLVSLFSCKKKGTDFSGKENAKDTISTKKVESNLFEKSDTICSPNQTIEHYVINLQKYHKKVEEKISQSSPEQNNKLYEDYLKVRDKNISCLSELLSNVLDTYVNYYDEESNKYKFPDKIKKIIDELKKGNLEFNEVGEGYTEIESEPNYYYSLFGGKVTPDYDTYIKQLSKEAESLYSADAGIMISWKELGDRTIFWENYMEKYPNSSLYKKAKEIYNNYLYDYLFGMDNTPTHEYSGSTIYEENRKEFERIIREYPNSNVAKKTKELVYLFDSKVPEEEIHKRLNLNREY